MIKHNKACIWFAKLLNDFTLDKLSGKLLKKIIGTFKLFEEEIKKLEEEGKFKKISLVFRS